MQIRTVEEGFGIGSEFRHTCCAADNFRVCEVCLHWFNSSTPKWNLNIDGHPCQSEALSRGEQASVPLIVYWLPFPGEDSLDAALEEAWTRRHELHAMGGLAAARVREMIPPNPAEEFAQMVLNIADKNG